MNAAAKSALGSLKSSQKEKSSWPPPFTGEMLKSLRARMKLTQEEFASKFGFELESIQKWEQGIREPRRAATILLWLISEDHMVVAYAIYKSKQRGVTKEAMPEK